MFRSGRPNYGDHAIGYVQLKRKDTICYIRATISPEHKVKDKHYIVSVEINEEDEEIKQGKCLSCAASLGM